MLFGSTNGVSGLVPSVGSATGNVSDNVLDGVGLDEVIPVVTSRTLVACADEAIAVVSEACNGECCKRCLSVEVSLVSMVSSWLVMQLVM